MTVDDVLLPSVFYSIAMYFKQTPRSVFLGNSRAETVRFYPQGLGPGVVMPMTSTDVLSQGKGYSTASIKKMFS